MQQDAATFFAQAEDAAGADLPRFVKNGFDAFLECGILAHCFRRLRCGNCGHDKLVQGSTDSRERTMIQRFKWLLCSLAIAVAACGGGGGGGETPASPGANTLPVADAGPNQSMSEGQVVQLAGSGSDAQGAVTFVWTPVSGPTVVLSNAAVAAPSFTAPLIDTPTATIELRLTVTDSANATATDTIVVTVNNVTPGNTPPTANAGPDQTVAEGGTGQFSGSGSDVESAVTFAWTQVSGPTVTLSSTTVARPTYTAPQITTATATAVMQLAVTDSAGTSTTDSVTITIRDSATPVGVKQIIAGPTVAALGFAPGFVFANLGKPSIGRNGQIGFYGQADVSQTATAQRRAAVWLGRASNLLPVLREDDVIAGIPAPMTFGPTPASVSTGVPIVSTSGKLAIQVPLKNGPAGANAIVVHANGVTTNVVYSGQAAVGFPSGVTINNLDGRPYAFSDAGVVYQASTSSGAHGLWYWDFQTTRLLVASGATSTAYPTCPFLSVTSPFVEPPLINDQGDVVFYADVDRTTLSCPNMTLLRWSAGSLQVVADNTMAMPGLAGTSFEGVGNPSLDDTGGVAFAASMKSAGATRYPARWYRPSGGSPQLVSVNGEKIPPNFVATLSGTNSGTAMSASGHLLVNNGQLILRGQPRTSVPYTNLDQLGNSQLDNLLAGSVDASTLGSVASPAHLTSSGDVLFRTSTGVWLVPVSGATRRIGDQTTDDTAFIYSGARYYSDFGGGKESNLGNGLPAEHSDVGEIVSCLRGRINGSACTFIQSITY